MMKPISILLIPFLLQSLTAQDHTEKLCPYRSNWSIDGSAFGAALFVAFTASSIDNNLSMLSLSEINALHKNDINPIDRITAGYFSKSQSKISDVLVGSSIISPLLLFFDNDVRNDLGALSTMYLQTVLFSTFTPSYGKGGVKRIRPFVYGSSASLADKQDSEARRSFFSGHATWAFSTSIFFATVYTDYHPDSPYKDYVWGGAIGLASTVSILRVTSGAHFISDIIVGAAVGSTIGYMIPYIHRNNSQQISLQPMIGSDFHGMTITYHLK